jgi:hypothetical protein
VVIPTARGRQIVAASDSVSFFPSSPFPAVIGRQTRASTLRGTIVQINAGYVTFIFFNHSLTTHSMCLREFDLHSFSDGSYGGCEVCCLSRLQMVAPPRPPNLPSITIASQLDKALLHATSMYEVRRDELSVSA